MIEARLYSLVAALTAVSLAASAPAEAQVVTSGTWNAMVAPDGSAPPFWDGTSADGERCNIGYFLAYAAGAGAANFNANCANRTPSGALVNGNAGRLGGINGSYLSAAASNAATPFGFVAGTYQIEFLGQMAGFGAAAGQTLGIYTGAGHSLFQLLDLTGSTTVWNLTIGSAWSLGARDSRNAASFLYSDVSDWALFSERAVGNSPGAGGTWYAGLGDNAGDADYQDIVLRISAVQMTMVPEPATVLTLAMGVAMLGVLHRRRRNA